MFKKIYCFLTLPRMACGIFFIVLTAVMILSDPDYYWHIKTGEYIIDHRILPRQDIFSFTMAGQPWVLHEWLFQVFLAIVFTAFGAIGVKLFTVILSLTSSIFIYIIAKKISTDRIAAVVMFFLFSLMIPFFTPRPQLFTYIFFSFYLYGLLSFKYLNKAHYLYFFPLIMLLWVNLHGGYIVGVALLFFFALTELLSNFLVPKSIQKKRTALLLPFGIAVLSLAASSLNPDFIDHWKYPFQVMSMDVSKNYISEWRSPSFHSLLGKFYLILVVSFFAANIYRKDKPDLTEIFIPLFFIVQGFVALRHIPLAVLSTAPFIAVALNNHVQIKFPEFAKKEIITHHLERLFLSSNKDLGSKEYLLNWIILFVVWVAVFLAFPSWDAKAQAKINKGLPVEATNFVVEKNIQGRIFNTYDHGGYLIYRLYPEQKVFIDGRADMYGDDFVGKYKEIDGGLPGWDKEFDKYDIDYIVCMRTRPIRQLLLSRGDFSLVYDDEYNSVLVKNIPRFANLIAEFEKSNVKQIINH